MKIYQRLFIIAIFMFCQPLWAADGQTFSWRGTIKKTIPVELQYTIQDGLAQGEIRYLNTAKKKPITVIGTANDDGSIRLLEFSPSGNITGVLSASQMKGVLTGDWSSTKSDNNWPISLKPFASKRKPTPPEPSYGKNILGTYSYQYGEDGYQGQLEARAKTNQEFDLNISSVTHAPARNIADINSETALKSKSNVYSYSMPKEESNSDYLCDFRVRFFKKFAYVEYTKPLLDIDCQFGWNATIEGFFFKMKP
jgi:hypothetical protein